MSFDVFVEIDENRKNPLLKMYSVVFIFGPSCSGKSTLGQALQENLGSEWSYLDRDSLIEQNDCVESAADQALEEKIQSIKRNIIIDAQIPWREKREGELYIKVFPPLEVLLARDSERTLKMNRSLERARGARLFVIETYKTLEAMDERMFDRCFDSSLESVAAEINIIRDKFLPLN